MLSRTRVTRVRAFADLTSCFRGPALVLSRTKQGRDAESIRNPRLGGHQRRLRRNCHSRRGGIPALARDCRTGCSIAHNDVKVGDGICVGNALHYVPEVLQGILVAELEPQIV